MGPTKARLRNIHILSTPLLHDRNATTAGSCVPAPPAYSADNRPVKRDFWGWNHGEQTI
jgi:hypothetical protein